MTETGPAGKKDEPATVVFRSFAEILLTERMEQNMRSEDVFAAAKKIGNRFLLCRVTSVAARRLQKGQKRFTDSINESLELIASMSPREEKGSTIGELWVSPDHIFVRSEPIVGPLAGDLATHSG